MWCALENSTRVVCEDMQKHLEDNVQHHLLLSNYHLTTCKEVVKHKKNVEATAIIKGVWKAAVVGN